MEHINSSIETSEVKGVVTLGEGIGSHATAGEVVEYGFDRTMHADVDIAGRGVGPKSFNGSHNLVNANILGEDSNEVGVGSNNDGTHRVGNAVAPADKVVAIIGHSPDFNFGTFCISI